MKLIRFIGMVIICILVLQTAESQNRPRIISPEVKSDRTVTFRFRAPQAHQVLVAVEYLDGLQPLRLGDDGIWAVTLGPFLDTANKKLRLFWIGIGKTDFLFERNENLLKLLREKDVEHTFRLSEGGHTWKNWRHYLHEFLQVIFR